MQYAWNRGDAAGYASLFVAWNGSYGRGRQRIEDAHRRLFDGPLAGSRMVLVDAAPLASPRFIRPDAAIVVVPGAVTRASERATGPDHNAVQTFVLTRNDERWLVAAFQNTRVLVHEQGLELSLGSIVEYYDLGGFGRHVTTSSAAAQLWFDRGLAWTYGFNHDEAVACFEAAAEADPGCAMAHWGIAYALGPNYNKPWELFDTADLTRTVDLAHAAVERARATSAGATRPSRHSSGRWVPGTRNRWPWRTARSGTSPTRRRCARPGSWPRTTSTSRPCTRTR